MKKLAIVVLVLAILTGGYFLYRAITQKPKTGQKSENTTAQNVAEKKVGDLALKNALNLYAQHKQIGTDFSNGPCLGIIAPDWVLDIAHNPRQPIDDKVENQCQDFREGRAHHFIELDPAGNLIKAF